MLNTAIVIFCFNRPDALSQLLAGLGNCKETYMLPLYIFIDCERFIDEKILVQNTALVAQEFDHPNKKIIRRSSNFGLRLSLTNGISEVFKLHDSVIVLEDDLVIGLFALDYFLHSLIKYKYNQMVWSVCGYAIGDTHKESCDTAHFLPMTHPWGWATWKDRWLQHMSGLACLANLNSASFKLAFNAFGLRDYRTMLWLSERGFTSSWWIYWQLNSVNRHTVSIFPGECHVINDGLKGGTHSSRWNLLVKTLPSKVLASTSSRLPDEVLVDFCTLDRIIASREAMVMRVIGFLGMLKRFLWMLASK